MDWTKIPTDLIIERRTDNEIIAIVKYQLLWAFFEEEPTKEKALRYMTKKQYELATSYKDSIKMCVTSDILHVVKKRGSEKKRYNKIKSLDKNLDTRQDTKQDTSMDDQIRLDKIKKYKEKEPQNGLKDDTEDKNNPKWTDRDRWEKGWVDRTKYIICYKGIVPKDWKPTTEDYEKSDGYPYYYDNLPKRYRFEGKIIKLDEKDYNKWKKEFNKLDLEKELYGLDGWALENFKNDKSKLFWVIHGMLVKKQKEKIKNNPDSDKYWL